MSVREGIQEDLPNFPADVIDQWLLPFAETDGWPPDAPRWKHLLTNTDLNYWRTVNWALEEVALEELPFTSKAADQINGLIEAYVDGVQNDFALALGARGLERFQFQQNLLQQAVPLRSVVLVNHGEGFDVMDGNHRLAGSVLISGCG